jgi:hypothetical protein
MDRHRRPSTSPLFAKLLPMLAALSMSKSSRLVLRLVTVCFIVSVGSQWAANSALAKSLGHRTLKEERQARASYPVARFTVKGKHRYRIAITISRAGASLIASKGHTAALYHSDLTQSSGAMFRAQFSGLGKIAVTFTPSRTALRPPLRGSCASSTAGRPGVFVGTIRFRGEGGYTSVDLHRARGAVKQEDSKRHNCNGRLFSGRPTSRVSAEKSGLGMKVVSVDRGKLIFFSAGRQSISEFRGWETEVGVPLGLRAIASGQGVPFTTVSIERRRAVRIIRLAAAAGPKRTLLRVEGGLAASASPPAPFSGTALLSPCSLKQWQGDLSVAFPGRSQALVGHEFAFGLTPQPTCAGRPR